MHIKLPYNLTKIEFETMKKNHQINIKYNILNMHVFYF
jgi:hypothetical protein